MEIGSCEINNPLLQEARQEAQRLARERDDMADLNADLRRSVEVLEAQIRYDNPNTNQSPNVGNKPDNVSSGATWEDVAT